LEGESAGYHANVSECLHSSAAITLTRDTCPRSFTGALIDMPAIQRVVNVLWTIDCVSLESDIIKLN